MYLKVSVGSVPPVVELHEPDDFKAFKVVVAVPQHAYVSVDELRELAGDRASEREWQDGLAKMLAFAAEHGWTGPDGAVRAHIEYESQA